MEFYQSGKDATLVDQMSLDVTLLFLFDSSLL